MEFVVKIYSFLDLWNEKKPCIFYNHAKELIYSDTHTLQEENSLFIFSY